MRKYELVFIMRPDLEEETNEAVIAKFTNIVEKDGGEMIKVDKWGKRRLAYAIDKLNEGIYVIFSFKAEAPVTHELERVIKITGEVIRHLMVRLED